MKKINILIVCAGNTCRSVMAAKYLEHIAANRADIVSRGLRPGKQVPEEVYKVLSALGIPRFEHTPRKVTAEDINSADRVYAMETAHRTELEALFPQAAGKTALFDGDSEIADPFGLGPAAYKTAIARIEKSAKRICATL